MKPIINPKVIVTPNFNFCHRTTPILESEICKILSVTPNKLSLLQTEMKLFHKNGRQVHERGAFELNYYNFWDLYELSLGVFSIYSEYFIHIPEFRYEVVDSVATVYDQGDDTGVFEFEAFKGDMNELLRQYLYDTAAQTLDTAFARSCIDCLFIAHARLTNLQTWKAEFHQNK
jgi:hypothetical protein